MRGRNRQGLSKLGTHLEMHGLPVLLQFTRVGERHGNVKLIIKGLPEGPAQPGPCPLETGDVDLARQGLFRVQPGEIIKEVGRAKEPGAQGQEAPDIGRGDLHGPVEGIIP